MLVFRLSHLLRATVLNLKKNMRWIVLAAIFVGSIGVGIPFTWCLVGISAAYLASGGTKTLWLIWNTLPRDAKAGYMIYQVMKKRKDLTAANAGIPTLFAETCKKYPDKTALIDAITGKSFTFQEIDEISNKVANYFKSQGFLSGDSVAMFMESSPEYVCIWLGLSKAGIIPALINFNLRLESMAHCIQAASAKGLIYGSSLSDPINEARHLFTADLPVFCFGNSTIQDISLDSALISASSHPPPTHQFDFNGTMIYVYTSGTTGLPKAAKVSHSRFFFMAASIAQAKGITEKDIVYTPLPLYHSNGGILGIGQAVITGSCVVIRKRFSASNFWLDCCKYRCTLAQYIGELCRYLLAQPIRPEETQHSVRMFYGNGLKPAIWTEVVNRFGIRDIGEFYGATEGNASTLNTQNVVGSIGFISKLVPALQSVALIKVDPFNATPIRDADGFCIRCEPGEPGEMIGKIENKSTSLMYSRFDGYSSKDATNKKIAENVFKRGDSFFLTGDILVQDEYGNLFFRDRTGDTFRWKGENVSTAEVEAVISNHINKLDAVVYGVQIPGTEGRAGMVAIENETTQTDLVKLNSDLKQSLPAYARPLFVRLLKHVEKTGTFKLKKVELRDQAYDPSLVSDPLYYLNPKSAEYEKITPEVFQEISTGKIRF